LANLQAAACDQVGNDLAMPMGKARAALAHRFKAA